MSDWEKLREISLYAYEFLRNFIPDSYEDGRYELQDGLFVNVESYKTQLRRERKFEAHEKYIDVQYMISGRELITTCPIEELECIDPYDEERDIAFYKNDLKGVDNLLVAGNFLIFLPGEAHMPCICVNQQENVRKAVIKIPV